MLVRQFARTWAIHCGFGLLDQTKMVTATSELARNTLTYGNGGVANFEVLEEGPRRGMRVTFEDQGPGIEDVELALKDGYTTGEGLGLGLSGSKRLMHEFKIDSKVGVGTKVTICRWK